MSAVAFDATEYASQLESVGFTRAQAELVAKGSATMFVHNLDALVTRDYLDTRIDQLRADMNARFERVDAKMDARFAQVDARFEQIEERMGARFELFSAEFNGKLGQLRVMLGVIMVAVSVPIIQSLVAWAG